MKSIQIMLLFISSLFLTNPLMAQRPGENDSRFSQIIEHLEEKLDLSEEQVAQLEVVVEDFEGRAETLRGQEFENRQARHAATKELRMEFWTAVKEVLTEEQLAQLGGRRGEGEEHPCDPDNFDIAGLRAALENYRAENIKPVMLELRADLDGSISAEDQATIANLRIAFADFKAQMKALKEEAREEGADRQAIRMRMKALKEGIKDEHESMRGLLEHYKEDIKAAFESIAEQRATWDTEQQAIKVTYLGEECANRHEHGRRGGHSRDEGRGGWHDRGGNGNNGGRGGRGGRGGDWNEDRDQREHGRHGRNERGHHHHKAKKAAHFLLLDPSGGNLTDGKQEAIAPALRVSPNPIYSITTLTYEVPKDAHITILLQDNNGNILQQLVDRKMAAGSYSIEIDLSRYRTGSYYFTMNNGTQQVSTTAIIARQ